MVHKYIKARITSPRLIPKILVVLCLLTPEFVAASEKGRQAKLQQMVDQRAMQMQADGTVDVASDCRLEPPGETRAISDLRELRRLIMTGNYVVNSCRLNGSKPERFAEVLRGNTYYPIVIKPNTQVSVSSFKGWGSRFEATGPTRKYNTWNGSSYTTQTGYNSTKNFVTANRSFPGTSIYYLVLSPNTISAAEMRKFCDNEIKLPVNEQVRYLECSKFYPSHWDNALAATIIRYKSALNLISYEEYWKARQSLLKW